MTALLHTLTDRFVASVLDQLTDAIVVLDLNNRVLAFNGAATRPFGELRHGATVAETLPLAARNAIDTAGRAADGHGEAILFVRETGTEYGLRATTLRDSDGQPIGRALVARDVTEMRRQEKRRQLIAAAVRVLASTLDVKAGLQQLTNLLVAEFAEFAAADIIESDGVKRYAVSARTQHDRALMERTRGINLRNREHPSIAAIVRGETIVRNDLDEPFFREVATSKEHLEMIRELRPRAIAVSPLRGDELIGVILVGRCSDTPFSQEDADTIAEIARQASRAVHNARSYHAAAEASRLKDEFLATISHELRTPMTSILGWAQLLRVGQQTPDTLRDGLDSIERSARAQAQLIDDLLDLSRMQMGKLHFAPRPFSLTAVVRAAVETVRPAAQARRVTLIVDAPRDVAISGDPDRMQQVVWNLLTNAVKFSGAGGDVRVTVTSDDETARVIVADRGQGIAADFLPHVFDRFRQADASATRRVGGLGLGLAIVKQLVEMHGGTVEAASPGIGQGATFTVIVPVTHDDEKLAAAPEDRSALTDLTGLSAARNRGLSRGAESRPQTARQRG